MDLLARTKVDDQSFLGVLSANVAQTTNDQNLRLSCLKSGVLEYANEFLNENFDCEDMYKLRVCRGVVLLVRNCLVLTDDIAVSEKLPYGVFCQNVVNLQLTILSKLVFATVNIADDEFLHEKLIPVFLQCLSNLNGSFQKLGNIFQYDAGEFDGVIDKHAKINEVLAKLDQFLTSYTTMTSSTENVFLIYLNQLLLNSHYTFSQQEDISDDLITNEVVYRLLSSEKSQLLSWFINSFVKQYDSVYENETVDESQLVVHLSIMRNLALHESFGKFLLTQLSKEHNVDDYLFASEILLTNLETFSTLKLAVILTWLIDVYSFLLNNIEKHFQAPQSAINVSSLHKNFCNVLLIMNKLLQFPYTVEYLNNVKFLGKLIQLVQLLHAKVKPITKFEETKTTKIVPSMFPNLKKFAIEAIGHLVAGNHDNQELIRESHCLEVILSCCVIDSINPYIKEVAIVCIRYILENNYENQKFVSQLEAKKVVNEEELKQSGIELEMVDGKVKFKK